MKLKVFLNNNKTILEASGETPLSQVLRKQGLLSVKNSGQKGKGFSCTVLLNGRPVPSDIVPFAIIGNSEIETLEYFKTQDEFQTISKSFEHAGIKLCSYCNAGMFLTAYYILKTYPKPSLQEIEREIDGMSFCCTNKNQFITGIRIAVATKIKNERSKI